MPPQRAERHAAHGDGRHSQPRAFREKTRPADPALPVLQHRRSGNGHQQRSCGIVEQLCHKIRIPYPDVDLYGLPLHLQCQAPHHQDGRHAGPEVPRAPERRADRRL